MSQDMPSYPVRVVLALAKPIERNGLRAVLEAENEVEIVAEVDDADAAARAVVVLRPDVVVLDCDLSDSLDARVDTIVRLMPHCGAGLRSLRRGVCPPDGGSWGAWLSVPR